MTTLLLPSDVAFLEAEHPDYAATVENDMVCLVIKQFPLVAGLAPATNELLVRLAPGYPDAAPDMFWFATQVARGDGVSIPAADTVETYLGRNWYRWSRHIGGLWRPGIDDLRNYFGYIHKCLLEATA